MEWGRWAEPEPTLFGRHANTAKFGVPRLGCASVYSVQLRFLTESRLN
jgi:hypothetical protein